MQIIHVAFLVFLSSCSLFKGTPSLKSMDVNELLKSIQLIGEGRGRLGLGEGQYVFGFDSILKENFDWLLAVQIPLHGEEALIFPDLRQKNLSDKEVESFEQRITQEFSRQNLGHGLSARQFMKELRSLIRFKLSSSWDKAISCKAQQKDYACEADGETYQVTVEDKEIYIKKEIGQGQLLVLLAQNLTDSIFRKTDIRLFENQEQFHKKNSHFSLELFWKN